MSALFGGSVAPGSVAPGSAPVVRRWPTLGIIAVLLLLMAIVDLVDDSSDPSAATLSGPGQTAGSSPGSFPAGGLQPASSQSVANPEVAANEAASWYCPSGWLAPQQGISTSLVVINPDAEAVGMWVTYYPNVFEGKGLSEASSPATRAVAGRVEREEAPPAGSLSITIPDSLIPPEAEEIFVSVLVELDRPGASVIQVLLDGSGRSMSACAEGPASQWHFPTGSTTSDAHLVLGLFNPFPDSAVVDVEFATEEGLRSPTAYSGLIVAPNSALYLDAASQAPRWSQLSTSVTARSGQLVAGRVQVFDGTRGLRGVSLALGAPALSQQWVFPAGAGPNEATAYVIYNPGTENARVELDFRLDFGSVTPTELLIPPGQQYAVSVNVGADGDGVGAGDGVGVGGDGGGVGDGGVGDGGAGGDSLPPFYLPAQTTVAGVALDEQHWAVVRTLSGSGVVAEQLRGGGSLVVIASDGATDSAADGPGDLTTDSAGGELEGGELEGGNPDGGESDGGESDAGDPGDAADSGITPAVGILDELAEIAEPDVIVRAAFGELGFAVAATKYIALGAFSSGPVVESEPGVFTIASPGIAIANPSSATIARVTNLATGEELELGPRRKVFMENASIVVLESSTPVVVAPGYGQPGSRQIPEVFNR